MRRSVFTCVAVPVLFLVMSCLTRSALAQFKVGGSVVNESGEGVAGATVYALETLPRMGLEIRGMTVLAHTKTDGSGRFSLALDRVVTPYEHYIFAARHPDYGLAWRMSDNIQVAHHVGDSPETLLDFRIVMPDRGSIRGRVTDSEGDPVSGVVVLTALSVQNPGNLVNPLFMPPCETLLSARTDAEGRFLLDGLPEQGSAILRVSHPDYGVTLCGFPETWEEPPGITVGETHVQVTVERGATIEGNVTFEGTGGSAIGARVEALLVEEGARKKAKVLGLLAADTDDQGRYTLRLPEGAYGLQTTYPDWTTEAKQAVKVEKNAIVTGQDFVLTKGVLVSGRFVNEKTGGPVSDGYVLLRQGAGIVDTILAERLIRADENGAFSLRQPPGQLLLYVSVQSSGFVKEEQPYSGRYVSRMLVEGQDLTDLTLSVTPWWDFEGTVLAVDGQPVAGAEVYLADDRQFRAKTEDDGTFRLPLVGRQPSRSEIDELVALEARHPGLPGYCGFLVSALVNESDAQAVIEMKRTGALRGCVVDGEGRTVVSAEVQAMPSSGRRYWTGNTAVTNEAGRYEITDIPGDITYRVHLTASGYGSRTMWLRIGEGEVYDVPDLVLEVADMSIDGKATTEYDEPVAAARISCTGTATGNRVTTTDRQGRYRLEKLVNEQLGVWAYKEGLDGGWWRGRTTAMAGDKKVDIILVDEALLGDRQRKAPALAGRPAPALDVGAWVNGEPTDLAALRGKTVVLAFWDSADEKYADLVPVLSGLMSGSSRSRVDVVSVHGSETDPDALKQVISDKKIKYRVALDKPGTERPFKGATFQKYSVRRPPAVFIIDREGIVRYQDIPLTAVERAIKALLSEQ